MTNFIGRYNLRADEKGRIIIPSQFRDVLKTNKSSRIYITCSLADNCLEIYPDKEWDKLMEKVKELPRSKSSVKYFLRRVIGSALECEMDKQGRLQIPTSLREEGGINPSEEIVMLGLTDRIEVWDRKTWDKLNKPEAVDIEQFRSELAGLGI
ncbi:MraZ [Candidatus Magnetoovum chiemensis]|nr:MraZ [Candidatus Magnetoovum chiemensis]